MQGDCLALMRGLPDNSIDLIAADPPYFKVKDEAWDNQWATPAEFLAWLDLLAEQWARVLRRNGSLYCFASPQMRARVEIKIGERFNTLPTITWAKRDAAGYGQWSKACKAQMRSFFPQTEAIIFAEHYGDLARDYLVAERNRAGFTTARVAEAFQHKTGSRTITGMAGHWFNAIQWELPTEENYLWLRALFGPGFLLREYEDLRRPFFVTADVPHTDVWTFPTVGAYKGKHPCEKPAAMMEHIVSTSSRPGAVVLDCFMGSGATGKAALKLGRSFIGMEMDPGYFATAEQALRVIAPPDIEARITKPAHQPMRPPPRQRSPQLGLWESP